MTTNSPYDFSPKENDRTNEGFSHGVSSSQYDGTYGSSSDGVNTEDRASADFVPPVPPAPYAAQEQVSQPYSDPSQPYGYLSTPSSSEQGQPYGVVPNGNNNPYHPQQGQHQPQPGQYPYPYPYPYAVQPPSQALAITAVVLGSIALFFSWVPFFNIFTGLAAVAGVIVGPIGIVKANKGEAGGKTLAIVGTSISAVAILVGILINVAMFASL